MKTYRLSSAGRRLSVALLAGALLIWALALWGLFSTLRLSYNPLRLPESLLAAAAAGLPVAQIVPALLMLVLLIMAPLLIWAMLEEWDAGYTPQAQGLRFEALGMVVLVPWSAINALHTDDDPDEPLDELHIAGDYTAHISGPARRTLHRLAFGRRRLPIYPGVADRAELLEEIRRQLAAVA